MISALIIGFVGSLHCVGMCGPIALALPTGGRRIETRLIASLSYQFGRVTTYAMMGTVAGTIGQGIEMAGFQQGLSIGLGVALLVLLLVTGNQYTLLRIPFLNRFLYNIKQSLARLLKTPSSSSMFQIGLLNGFLPCGVVYLALSGAMATGNVFSGIGFMVLFGLGTFPAMMAVSLVKKWLKPGFIPGFQKILWGMAFIFACLLIVRGLNLGIPYLSPEIAGPIQEVAVCE
jgi:sulfite exporter TauE/SafE